MKLFAYFDQLSGITNYRDESGNVVAMMDQDASGNSVIRGLSDSWQAHAQTLADGSQVFIGDDGSIIGHVVGGDNAAIFTDANGDSIMASDLNTADGSMTQITDMSGDQIGQIDSIDTPLGDISTIDMPDVSDFDFNSFL